MVTEQDELLDDLLAAVERTLQELQRLYSLLENNAEPQLAIDAWGEARQLVGNLESIVVFLKSEEE